MADDSGDASAARTGDETTIRLPVVSDSLAADDDVEEDALFGSEDEEDLKDPAAKPAATAASSGKAAARAEDDLEDRDLFGDDDVDEKDLFGSDGEGNEPEIDEKELFGSDEEATDERKPADAAGKPAPEPSEAEPSEFDEREIFGDISDDDVAEKDIDIRRRPAPSDDRTFKSLRLPNVLSVDKTPFDSTNIAQSLLEGYKEFKNTTDRQVVKLLNPENTCRWRFKKGADGQNLMDEDGRPQYESNARLVEWEDGSRSFFIGAECFNVSEIEDSAVVFEENSKDVQVCHGRLMGRLIVTPRNLDGASHTELKKTQFRKANPVRRSLLLGVDDSETTEQQFYELEMEQKKRHEKQALKRIAEGGQELTAAFLEEDQPAPASQGEAGPSLLDVKRQFKAART